jgi:hypothetical protein
MGLQKVEFEFPDDKEDGDILEVESSTAVEIDLGGGKTTEDYREEDPNLEIEVVDDTPEEDQGKERSIDELPPIDEEELNKYSRGVQKRIKQYTKGFHDERREKEKAVREREELENVARNLLGEVDKLKDTINKNQTILLDQTKKAATVDLENARKAYKTAHNSGDSDELLIAQEALTSAKFKIDRLDSFTTQRENKANTQNTPAPQVDQRAKDWAAKNTWFGVDDEMTSLALGYHSKLVKSGIDPKSDEYYDKINARIKQFFPEEFKGDTASREVRPRRADDVVAPATRSRASNRVKLTQTQVAIANKLGVPLEEYAKQALELGRR